MVFDLRQYAGRPLKTKRSDRGGCHDTPNEAFRTLHALRPRTDRSGVVRVGHAIQNVPLVAMPLWLRVRNIRRLAAGSETSARNCRAIPVQLDRCVNAERVRGDHDCVFRILRIAICSISEQGLDPGKIPHRRGLGRPRF